MDEVLQRLHQIYIGFLKALPRIGFAILLLVLGVLVANWITSVIRRRIKASAHDPLMGSFLAKAIKIVLVAFLCLLVLRVAGLGGIAAGILATFGASAVVLGFAFKDIAENFLAGLILTFNRPFKVNDTVQVESVFGKVKEMEFRYTKITTFDGRNVYIPNSDVLTKPVFNYTEDGYYRTDFVVGIAYENDPEKAKELIQQCFEEDNELVHDDQHTNFVVEDELAPSTLNLKIYMWVQTDDFRRGMLETRGRLLQKVKKKLESNGFNLPADIRELKFYAASQPFEVISKDNAKEQAK